MTHTTASTPLPWTELLPRTPLQPHARHEFEAELRAAGGVTHVRFNIFPDGGVGAPAVVRPAAIVTRATRRLEPSRRTSRGRANCSMLRIVAVGVRRWPPARPFAAWQP